MAGIIVLSIGVMAVAAAGAMDVRQHVKHLHEMEKELSSLNIEIKGETL